MIWEEPIHKSGTSYENLKNRLLIPGNFPPGIQEHLPSARPGKGRRRDVLYVTPSDAAQARIVLMWAPFIDTAFHTAAYRISDFQVLNDYIVFYERPLRKVLTFVDLLSLNLTKKSREEDKPFISHLLEQRAQRGKVTMIDTVPKAWRSDVELSGYEEVIDVKG